MEFLYKDFVEEVTALLPVLAQGFLSLHQGREK